MDNLLQVSQLLLCVQAFLVAVAAITIVLEEESAEEDEQIAPLQERVNKTAIELSVLRSLKRKLDAEAEDQGNSKKRKVYNYERARLAIQEDYLGPQPQFGHLFSRIFRVTRPIVERIIQIAGNGSPFFTQRKLITGEPGICPEAKALMGLKQLCYGASSSAFWIIFKWVSQLVTSVSLNWQWLSRSPRN